MGTHAKLIYSEGELEFLRNPSHSLVVGGPGSGKTTLAVVRAKELLDLIGNGYQRAIFLSFARTSTQRAIEALHEILADDPIVRKRIGIDTYHSFFWKIIRTHGYLLGLPRNLQILTPPKESIKLSSIRDGFDRPAKLSKSDLAAKEELENEELTRIAFEEGKVAFRLFSTLALRILEDYKSIRDLVCSAYPIMIFDEFQDTDPEQWQIVRCLGEQSQLTCLADPEQRIYDFIGADPERINHYVAAFSPNELVLTENRRSGGTEIVQFADDLVSGSLEDREYSGIKIIPYNRLTTHQFLTLKSEVLKAVKRLSKKKGKDWSLAVIVSNKTIMRLVSDEFESVERIGRIPHKAAIDVNGAILSAELVAYMLHIDDSWESVKEVVALLIDYYEGRNAESPTKGDIIESKALRAALGRAEKALQDDRKIPKGRITEIVNTCSAITQVQLTGNADSDWRNIRETLQKSKCKRLNQVAQESRNLRLLTRGGNFRELLAECWRENGNYSRALEYLRLSMQQEYLYQSRNRDTGIVIMNMHKAKGKQFDEVVIFDGWPLFKYGTIIGNLHRLVRGNSEGNIDESARFNVKVSVTRSRIKTTILTPVQDPCILLQPG